MTQHTSPCKSCPWHRDVVPGALGGSTPDVYVGQIIGPFWLPCHSSPRYRGKTSKPCDTLACAGAAQFRTKLGLDRIMPRGMFLLPPSDKVFDSLTEFVAHHMQCSAGTAALCLNMPGRTPVDLLKREISKQEVQLHLVPKPESDNL
jgi:hypothetical protein